MKVSNRYEAVSDAESRTRGDALVAWLRDYAERRVNSRLIDERRCIPPHVALDFGNRGLFGIQVEERFGGLALRNREIARVLEQAAAIDLGLGTWLLTSLFPGVRPIAAFATSRLQAELLPLLAQGRLLAGYAQTEPGAGTHFAAMAARAQAGARGWALTGEKVWIGNATWAGVLTVMAHDVDEGGRRRGLTAFAVRTEQPGVALGRELLSLGMRGMVQSEVGFRDVAVGPDAVVGERGKGLEVGVDSMSWSRFAIAATCVGAMKRCAQLMLRFASRRTIATGKLVEHPVLLASLGEVLARIRGAEGLLYRVADALDRGDGVAVELFAACKLVASEFLWQSADALVQSLGSRGYDEENLAPQLLRDARVTRIFEGTSEALAAFLGAAALVPSSEIYSFLRRELEADALADELAAALGQLRARDGAALGLPAGELPRAWHCALAGSAAGWALVAAVAAQDTARAPAPELARVADWSRRQLADSLERATRGAPEEHVLFDATEAEKAVSALAGSVGDPEQRLPGERRGLDPLLHRTPPANGS
jgi:alkylation response protein AidB-like acyl-CoA dehydrogenase